MSSIDGIGKFDGPMEPDQPQVEENVQQKRIEMFDDQKEAEGSGENQTENKEILEKGAELKEVTEAASALEAATHDGEAKVESERDYKEAEALQEVFTAAMDAVPETKEADPVSEGTDAAEDPRLSGGGEDPGSGLPPIETSGEESESEAAKEQSDLPEAMRKDEEAIQRHKEAEKETLEAQNDVMDDPQTEVAEQDDESAAKAAVEGRSAEKTESASASRAEVIEAVEQAKEGPRAQVEKAQPPAVEAAIDSAADSIISDESNLDGKGDETPGIFMVDQDGDDGSPQIDYGGVETGDDIRQPTSVSDAYAGGGMGDAERGDSVGYQGDMDGMPGGMDGMPGGEVEIPEAGPGGGGPGMEPGDLGGPDVGLDQMGEMGDLAGAAAFGADGRISEGDTGDTGDSGKGDSDDSGKGDSDDSGGKSSGDTTDDKTGDTSKAQYWKDGKYVDVPAGTGQGKKFDSLRNVAGRMWSKITSDSGPDKPEGAGHTGPRGTPDPESGEGQSDPHDPDRAQPDIPEHYDPMDQPLDYAESMSQPVDDEGDHRPPPIEFNPDSNVDPYAQYTGEESSGVPIGGAPDDLDPDGSLIDPPEVNVGGDEGTFINTESSSINDEEEGLEEGGLESSDPLSMDGKGND